MSTPQHIEHETIGQKHEFVLNELQIQESELHVKNFTQ